MGHCFVTDRLNVANFFRKLPSLLVLYLLAFNLSSSSLFIQLCQCRSIEVKNESGTNTDIKSVITVKNASDAGDEPLQRPPSPSTISTVALRSRSKNIGSIVSVETPAPLLKSSNTADLSPAEHEKRFSNGHQIVVEAALSEPLSPVSPPTIDTAAEVTVAATPTSSLPVVELLNNENSSKGEQNGNENDGKRAKIFCFIINFSYFPLLLSKTYTTQTH